MKKELDIDLLMSLYSGDKTDETTPEAKAEPIKEKSASFSFYRQVSEQEESNAISEPTFKLRNFLDGYYSEIHPITGKKQTIEEYLREIITEARNDLRRGNYFDKEAHLEFLGELESYLTIWREIRISELLKGTGEEKPRV